MDTRSPEEAVIAAVETKAAAHLARECPMAGWACALARWVGRAGRPVTASRVLRRVDVAPAGSVLDAAVPGRVRTAADVPVLHRPWSFALGAGLLEIDGATAVAGPLLERWSSLGDAELLDACLAGVRAVCAAESDPRYEQSVATLAFVFLEVVADRDCPNPDCLWNRLIEVIEQQEEDDDWPDRVPFHVLNQYRDRATDDRFAGLVDLLGQFGAVTGDDTQTVAATALGRWVVANVRVSAAADTR